ncbi:MAG: hypothetical protein V9E94_07245 [Microthrixaceae bacterium]
MPNPSGANASSTMDDLVAHLRAAAQLADDTAQLADDTAQLADDTAQLADDTAQLADDTAVRPDSHGASA